MPQAYKKKAKRVKRKTTRRPSSARQASVKVWGRNRLDPHSYADGSFYSNEGLYGVAGPYANPRYNGRIETYGLAVPAPVAPPVVEAAAAPVAAAEQAPVANPAAQRRLRSAMQRVIRELR